MEKLSLSPKTSQLFKQAFEALEQEVIESGEGITCQLEIDGGDWVNNISDAAWDLLNLHAEKNPDLSEEIRNDITNSEPESTKINYRFQLTSNGVTVDRVVFIGTSIY